MKQDSKDNNLSLVLKCVDEFAKLYIDAVLGWAEQNQCSLLDITFSLGAAPYKFPPDMIVKINGHKKIIYDFWHVKALPNIDELISMFQSLCK